MSHHIVVADTGPLIGLARVGRLDLLRQLYRDVMVPSAVHAELALDTGRPGARLLREAFDAGWITARNVTDSAAVSELAHLLDPGASEAIVLAEQENARFLLIDEARGRRVARERGISVVGVAGILLVAKSSEVLNDLGPVLEELARAGYRLSPRLVAAILARAGE